MKALIRIVCSPACAVAAGLLLCSSAHAAVFSFTTDPFANSTALTTPGRQVVGGEDFISFSIANDVFSFNPAVFGLGNSIQFASGLAASLPTSGANVIVLLSFDNDANSGTPFGAGNAADLIASRVTTSGAGFFIYFNQSLDLARLVYSTDLNDSTADLKIMARLTNLSGQAGRDAMPTITASNFQIGSVPETGSTLALLLGTMGLVASARFAGRCQRVAQA